MGDVGDRHTANSGIGTPIKLFFSSPALLVREYFFLVGVVKLGIMDAAAGVVLYLAFVLGLLSTGVAEPVGGLPSGLVVGAIARHNGIFKKL